MKILEQKASGKIEKIARDGVVVYDSLSQFLSCNNLDADDFREWAARGADPSGFLFINCCYWLAGDATSGIYMKITTLKEVINLLFEDIKAVDFYDTTEMLNDDSRAAGCYDDIVDPSDAAAVLSLFFEFCREIALIPINAGTYKGGYMLVVDQG